MALSVNLTGNSTGFKRMLDEAKADTKAFTGSLNEEISGSFVRGFKRLAAGFLGFEAFDTLKESFSWFKETGTQIKDISDQLGISTDEWQKWADAVGQAGLQTEGFVRVIESLKEKRTEALTDPKARAQLTQLGFTDAEISGGMSTSDFVRKALQNANNSPWSKQAFDTIAGVEGVRYMRALGYLPSAKVEFTSQDLQDATRLQQAEHTAQTDFIEPLKKGLVHVLLSPNFWKSFSMPGGGAWWQATSAFHWWRNRGKSNATTMGQIIGSQAADYAMPTKPAKKDPLEAVFQQQERDFAFRDQERAQRVADSARELMTIGDRMHSIKAEMRPLAQQIQQHKDALKTPEGFLTDAEKQSLAGMTGLARTIQVNELREKYQDEMAELQIRYNKDKADLRQGPLNFQADNLAKVGLYSASALKFNPVLGLHQKTNQLLERIATNTARPVNTPPTDPDRP